MTLILVARHIAKVVSSLFRNRERPKAMGLAASAALPAGRQALAASAAGTDPAAGWRAAAGPQPPRLAGTLCPRQSAEFNLNLELVFQVATQ